MTFGEELSLVIIEKVLLAAIAALIWHFYTRWQKKIDREQARADRFEEEARTLRQKSVLERIDQQIKFVETSLEEFYWPLTLCMRQDDAVWKRVPSLYEDGSQLPTEAGSVVESQFLLPNHERAVSIIGSRFHLIATENELIEPMIQYIRHVTVFKALRAAGLRLNPIDVGEPFPDAFLKQLEDKMASNRAGLARLREERAQMVLDAA